MLEKRRAAAHALGRGGGVVLVDPPILLAGNRIDREDVVFRREHERPFYLQKAGIEAGVLAGVIRAEHRQFAGVRPGDLIEPAESLGGQRLVVTRPALRVGRGFGDFCRPGAGCCRDGLRVLRRALGAIALGGQGALWRVEETDVIDPESGDGHEIVPLPINDAGNGDHADRRRSKHSPESDHQIFLRRKSCAHLPAGEGGILRTVKSSDQAQADAASGQPATVGPSANARGDPSEPWPFIFLPTAANGASAITG